MACIHLETKLFVASSAGAARAACDPPYNMQKCDTTIKPYHSYGPAIIEAVEISDKRQLNAK